MIGAHEILLYYIILLLYYIILYYIILYYIILYYIILYYIILYYIILYYIILYYIILYYIILYYIILYYIILYYIILYYIILYYINCNNNLTMHGLMMIVCWPRKWIAFSRSFEARLVGEISFLKSNFKFHTRDCPSVCVNVCTCDNNVNK